MLVHDTAGLLIYKVFLVALALLTSPSKQPFGHYSVLKSC